MFDERLNGPSLSASTFYGQLIIKVIANKKEVYASSAGTSAQQFYPLKIKKLLQSENAAMVDDTTLSIIEDVELT